MKFFSVLIALQLIMAPVSLAAGNQSTTEEEQKIDPNNPSKVSDPQTDPVYEGNSQNKSGYDFYAKQILSMSTSIIGTNIISQCSFGMKIPSIATFMAGSLVYIASELLGAKKQNENHNKKLDDLILTKEKLAALKGGGEVQREAIELKLKEEKDTREYLLSRKGWLLAVTTMYTAAAGLAILEETGGISAGVATGTSTCTGLSAMYAARDCAGTNVGYAACYAAKYAMHMGMCTASMPSGWAQTLPNFANPASVAIAQGSCIGTYAPACLAYLNSYLAIAYANCSPLSIGSGISGMLMAKAITAAYSMGLSAAGGTSFTNYVTMMYALFSFFIPSIAKLTMASYNYPIPRVATFGVSAALVGMITAGLGVRVKVADENIEKLQKLYNQFRTETDTENGIAKDKPAEEMNHNENKKQEYEVKITDADGNYKAAPIKELSGQNMNKNECVALKNKELEVSNTACKNPVVLSRPNPVNLPGAGQNILKDASNLGLELSNAISKGNTEEANALAGRLGSMADSVRAATLGAQEEYNKAQKKRFGKDAKELNLDHEIKRELAWMKGEYQKATAKDPKIANALKGLDFNLSHSSLMSQEEKSDTTESTPQGKGEDAPLLAVSSPADIPASEVIPQFSEGIEGDPNFGEGLFEGRVSTDNPEGLSDEAYRAARANGYLGFSRNRYKGDDGISPMVNSSIFKQISNRYFHSYPKILVRKKIQEKESAGAVTE
jgi:hypothetical protein